MVRRSATAVPILVLLLGLVAAGLSFLAYAKRIKIEDVTTTKDGLCIYPRSPAFAVGILAAIFILIQQVLLTVGTACFCCSRNKFSCNFCAIISLFLFALSWLSFVITFIGLLYTAVINNNVFLRDRKYMTKSHKKEDCLLGKESLFLGAAIWCVITLFFSLSCYATLMCGRHLDRRSKHRHEFGA